MPADMVRRGILWRRTLRGVVVGVNDASVAHDELPRMCGVDFRLNGALMRRNAVAPFFSRYAVAGVIENLRRR